MIRPKRRLKNIDPNSMSEDYRGFLDEFLREKAKLEGGIKSEYGIDWTHILEFASDVYLFEKSYNIFHWGLDTWHLRGFGGSTIPLPSPLDVLYPYLNYTLSLAFVLFLSGSVIFLVSCKYLRTYIYLKEIHKLKQESLGLKQELLEKQRIINSLRRDINLDWKYLEDGTLLEVVPLRPPENLVPENLVLENLVPENLVPENLVPENLVPENLVPENIQTVVDLIEKFL